MDVVVVMELMAMALVFGLIDADFFLSVRYTVP
jgi:hypothetical protein